MKTAISVPDAVFEEAEKLARRLGKSRSQLFSDAMREYVARHDGDAVSEAMDRVCEAVDSRLDPAFRGVTHRRLKETEW